MKNIKKKVIVAISAIVIVVFLFVGSVTETISIPMTMCLTFDDGLKAHATVAGPVLEKYGWRGAFNVITQSMSDASSPLASPSHMSWSQAKELFERGHEIYPHTMTHPNCGERYENEREFIEKEIIGSASAVEEHVGNHPSHFCFPYNSTTQSVNAFVRSCNMEPMNCGRRNFPTGPYTVPMSISEYIKQEWKHGTNHVDIMIHGIIRAEGGWEPFEDAEQFENFCKEISELEKSGIVRVVGYAEAHTPHSSNSQYLICRIKSAIKRRYRRLVFRIADKLNIL